MQIILGQASESSSEQTQTSQAEIKRRVSGHPNDFKISHGPESGLNSFSIRNRVVHKGETRGLSTTELGLESEDNDVVGSRLNI